MKRATLAVVGFIALLMSTGCASTKQFVAMPDQTKTIDNPSLSRIYLLRPTVLGAAITMRVDDGNRMIGETGPNGFLCWEREPGVAKLLGRAENESRIELTADPGQVYFVQQHVRMGWWTARNKLEVLPEERGRKLLEKCKPPSEFHVQ